MRVIVIGRYLKAMARLENKGPKIISQAEYDRMQHEAEQEQIRLDNASIQASINQALATWTHNQEQQRLTERGTMQKLIDETLGRWIDQQSQAIEKQFVTLQGFLQTPDFNTDDLTASIFASLRSHFDSQIEAIRQENEAATRRQTEATKRLIEAQSGESSEAHQRSVVRRGTEASPHHEATSKASKPGLLRLPTNGDRAAQKAEAFRLIDEEHMSTYKAAEITKIPVGTIQRWLSERKAKENAAQKGEAREA